MFWREAFLIRFGAGAFAGITLGRWLRVLQDNHFAVDRPYWGRAAVITVASIPNTLLAGSEPDQRTRRLPEASQNASPNIMPGTAPTSASWMSSTLLLKCAWPRMKLVSSWLVDLDGLELHGLSS
jgi:hypothetical protein